MKIQFIDSNPSDRRLIKHLESVKEQTGEDIKSQISKAALALYDVYAIGNNPDSTKADLEMGMLRCWNVLSTHLGEVALYGKNHQHNVSLSYPHVALIDSISLTYVPAVTSQVAQTIAEVTPNNSRDPIEFAPTTEAKKESEEEEEDDDDDPYAGMSKEEYLAATRHLAHSPKAKY